MTTSTPAWFSQVEEELKDLDEGHWMTADSLSGIVHVSPEEIEQTLRAHAADPNRRIRYCWYPSPRTLRLLWGHTTRVGELRNLPRLERSDSDPGEDPSEEASKLSAEAPVVFLSHNWRDARKVFSLRDQLAEDGVCGWMFESEIESEQVIVDEVLEALEECSQFWCFLSRWSLGSLWFIRSSKAPRERGTNQQS